jgi:hypothetical protein
MTEQNIWFGCSVRRTEQHPYKGLFGCSVRIASAK